jgi:hypothetical protein
MNLEELNKTPLGKMISLDENEGIKGYFGGIVEDRDFPEGGKEILLITSFNIHGAEKWSLNNRTEGYKFSEATYDLDCFLKDKKIVERSLGGGTGWCELKKGFETLLMERIYEERKGYNLEVSL